MSRTQKGWTGGIDLVVAQIYRDGSLHVDLDTTVALTLSDAQHQTLLADGLIVRRHIAVAPEAARLVVVARDAVSGTLGSVFVAADKARDAR